jgi:UDP-N-acetylglucosamine--dolichyl-phosphate N-acetylglucosaminephosphotransferase
MLIGLVLVFLVSFAATYVCVPWLMPKLVRAGMTGRDVNKADKQEIPEMGGFAVVFGLSSGILLAVGLSTFFDSIFPGLELKYVLAGLSTLLLMALIGIFDDLFAMHKAIKATLPLFAALPLVAVEAGTFTMTIPIIGAVDFGIFYILLLVPMGIAGASNVTNMLAGFNGLEAGMGFVACVSLSVIAASLGQTAALILLLPMAGALLAFLFYNRYPAKIFIGDIGTLSIGAVIASSVILGNFEAAGMVMIIPYALDFFIKAINRFPSSNWWGELVDGKLVCKGKPVGLCQWIMKLSGGISERRLVLSLVAFEALCGFLAVILFRLIR